MVSEGFNVIDVATKQNFVYENKSMVSKEENDLEVKIIFLKISTNNERENNILI